MRKNQRRKRVGREALDRALPDVMAAPTTETKVDTICYRPGFNKRVFPESLTLTRAGGVQGDYEMSSPWLKLPDGSPDPRNQVSLLPLRVLNLVWHDRKNTLHPGDAIIADLNTSHENLPIGSLLQVGSAVIGVSDVWNDGCAKWKVRYGREAYDWVSAPEHEALRLRGIYCWIEKDGEVRRGDKITKL
ncbi:MAG: hypothetical protein GY952_02900 [Rhodobacteraceae bacterium]|nr:hypothetical protein [Paracoccaceae bacterium]